MTLNSFFQVIQKYSDLKKAFVAFDKKRDGYVTLDELRRVLVHFVFPMSDVMFAQLMERYVVWLYKIIGWDHTTLFAVLK